MTQIIRRNQIDDILNKIGSHFFSVVFIKKNGEERQLNGHLKVKKYTKGGRSTIAGHDNLVSVWDRQIREYRAFDKGRVKKIIANGEEYIVEDD